MDLLEWDGNPGEAGLSARGEGQIAGTGAVPAEAPLPRRPFPFPLKVNAALDYAARIKRLHLEARTRRPSAS